MKPWLHKLVKWVGEPGPCATIYSHFKVHTLWCIFFKKVPFMSLSVSPIVLVEWSGFCPTEYQNYNYLVLSRRDLGHANSFSSLVLENHIVQVTVVYS